MDIQLKKGLIEICVLASLKKNDSYGYQIIKDLSTCVTISESTLYPILRRLESSECLNVYTMQHNGRLRKYYHLTVKGRERIDEFLNEWEQIMAIYQYIKGGNENE